MSRISHLQVSLKHSSYKALPMMLRVTFLAFPAVSSLAFKAFRCDDLDATDAAPGPSVLSAAYGITSVDAAGGATARSARTSATKYDGLRITSTVRPAISPARRPRVKNYVSA